MKRRNFLTAIIGGAAAVAVAPLELFKSKPECLAHLPVQDKDYVVTYVVEMSNECWGRRWYGEPPNQYLVKCSWCQDAEDGYPGWVEKGGA